MSLELSLPVNNTMTLVLLSGGITLAGACYVVGAYKECRERGRLSSALRTRKQRDRREKFQELERNYPLGKEQLEIVKLSLEELTQKLQKRELSARAVLEAYVAKALVATEEFNCVTEFAPKCFEWAEELDALPVPRGPLHGVPVCIKEDHDLEGMDTTMGYSSLLYQTKEESAVLVKVLQAAGAIPFCKTNLPQTIFSGSSENPIYGTTLNPLNKGLSPGGSSSGTGCLVGAGGALFGLGSDLGGSLRIPAHFCGVSTLRSTIGRLSGRGVKQCLEDCAGFTGVPGVMASTARALATVYEVITADGAQNKFDPLTVPVPWNRELFESTRPLRIGFYTSNPVWPAMGDTVRTVLDAKAALEALGHTLIAFELPDPYQMVKVFSSLITADRGSQIRKKLKHDAVSEQIAMEFLEDRSLFTYLKSKLLSLIFPASKRASALSGDPAIKNSEVLWQYLYMQRQIKYQVLDRMKALNLDIILCPAYPCPATTVEVMDVTFGGLYTNPYNLLDFPAGVTPFGKESCTNIEDYDDEGDPVIKLAKGAMKLSKDMPIAVQVVGKPFMEEMVLRILVQLEDYYYKQKIRT